MTNSRNVLDLSIQKSFLKDKSLTVTLSATDILNDNKECYKLDLGSYCMEQNNDYKRSAVILRVAYHFNSASSKYKGTGAGDSVKSRL